MARSSANFIESDKLEWEELGGGVSRKFLGWDNQIMMVKVKFEKGAEGAPHEHFHAQSTYCAEGKFEFMIGDEKKIIKAGDGVYFEPNVLHGAVCLEEGILIDVFSPVREDFLDGTGVSYFGK
ncbi:MAG: cupin domain-containing protein [Spirochaetales bacterium]|nr:cupin domain-containing protein [Spirochaetales bacterium]